MSSQIKKNVYEKKERIFPKCIQINRFRFCAIANQFNRMSQQILNISISRLTAEMYKIFHIYDLLHRLINIGLFIVSNLDTKSFGFVNKCLWFWHFNALSVHRYINRSIR